MTIGRPTKYNPNFSQQYIKMMKKGHSKKFVAHKLAIREIYYANVVGGILIFLIL